MIYTYYYGVTCVGKDCTQFISISPYQTNVRYAVADVDLGDGIPLVCPRCRFRYGYQSHQLLYSQKPDEMVPLDQ